MKVAVFGLGYVGTVTAGCLAASGHEVWGVDVDHEKVLMVAAGRSPVVEPGLDNLLAAGRASGRLQATASVETAIAGADASLVCVGTPSDVRGATNLDHVRRVVYGLADALAPMATDTAASHVIVIRSTVPPGTVEQIGRDLGEKLGLPGPYAGIAMCPEFLREGTGIADFYSPPYTVIGTADRKAADVVHQLFAFVDRPVHVVDSRTAEALKYASNAFHATKVCFANELGRVLQRYGIDTRDVMRLFGQDSQLNISRRYLRPGFAFGGSCLPKDLRSLLHLARMENVDLPMLSGVVATNRLAVTEAVDRVIGCNGRTIALLGLSFKMDSDDLRESPYVELAETLLGKGYALRIYDPIVNPGKLIGTNRQHVESKLPHLRSILSETPAQALLDADIAVVSIPATEIIEAIVEDPPASIIDLDGRLGATVEHLPGYQGISW
jgi:GDP-mannose 6-dehydrogenase